MDEIASTGSFEGHFYIFMRSGKIWEMCRDSLTGHIMFRLMVDLVPK